MLIIKLVIDINEKVNFTHRMVDLEYPNHYVQLLEHDHSQD